MLGSVEGVGMFYGGDFGIVRFIYDLVLVEKGVYFKFCFVF